MNPLAHARAALGAAGIAAPTDAQVTRCIALAALALALGDLAPFDTAASQLVADDGPLPEEK